MLQLFCALACEAKPIITAYRLKNILHHPFQVYEKDQLRVVVTGLGKQAMAAAVAYLYGRFDLPASTANLNVGIAGHYDAPLGTAVLINKIVDQATATSMYPVRVFPYRGHTGWLETRDCPCHEYQPMVYYDMEASAYFLTATRFSPAELVHCFKVVSDNKDYAAEQMDKKWVASLINDSLPIIDELIHQLLVLQQSLAESEQRPQELTVLLTQWKFSHYQRMQLVRILQRWQAFFPTISIRDTLSAPTVKSASDVMRHLEQKLKNLPGLL